MSDITNIINDIDSHTVSRSLVCSPENVQQNLTGKTFNILHTNIRSINCNYDSLITLVTRINVPCDVIILTECWLSRVVTIPVFDGYTSYKTQYSNQNDGVIVYIKSDIIHTVIERVIQDANCLITKLDLDFAVVAIYRSPAQKNIDNFIDSLDQTLASLSSSNTVVLIGDLNINLKENNLNTDKYLNVLASHGLLAAHTITTRDNACLDHVMLKSNLKSTTIVLDSPITDHAPTLFCSAIRCQHKKPTYLVTRINFPSVINDLSAINFTPILEVNNANVAATNFVTKITNVIESNMQLINIPNRKRCLKPWITPGLLRCIKHRDKLHKKSKHASNDNVLRIIYCRYRNFCNKLLKKLRIEYDRSELNKNKNNTKGMWRTIKNIVHLNNTPKIPVELLDIAENSTDSADQVNVFFANIGANLASKITVNNTNSIPLINAEVPYSSMAMLPTDEIEVRNIILGLRSKCSSGIDLVSNEVLKSAIHILVPPLTLLFNICLSTGVFPDIFKRALITPVHKSGDRHSVDNYRPISILSSISKILEKVINSRLVDYLDKNKIIAKNQYGFRKNMSTEDAVLELNERVVRLLDNKAKVIGIFLDLAKAFDTVSVPLLLTKMECLGIRGMVLEMFRSYMTNRSQKVKIGNVISNTAYPSYGVPQGSVLGPTLFLIYINNLCLAEIPNCRLISYADDTVLMVHGRDWDQARLNAENALSNIMLWLNNNLLTLNISKTKYITFSHRVHTQPAKGTFDIVAHVCNMLTANCSCLTLTRTDNIKYLGVIIDSTFSWHEHINALVGRIRKLIPIFKKLSACADPSTLAMVYSALAKSLLQYCITSWGGTDTTSILRTERAQRAILKTMTLKPRRYPTDALYRECKALTVRQIYILQCILKQHSSLSFNPVPQGRRFTPCLPVSHRTTLAKRQFYVNAPRLYNKINKLKQIYALTINQCKYKLKNWLLTCTTEDTEDLLK